MVWPCACVLRIALKIPVPVPTNHLYPPHTPDPDRASLSRNPLKGLSLGPDWIGQVPQPTRGTLLSLGSLATSNLLGNPSWFLLFASSFSPIVPPPRPYHVNPLLGSKIIFRTVIISCPAGRHKVTNCDFPLLNHATLKLGRLYSDSQSIA